MSADPAPARRGARAASDPARPRALRALIAGKLDGVGFAEATRARARELGVLGWVRESDENAVEVHAEGTAEAIESLLAFLREGPRGAQVAAVDAREVRREGHEQFAIRGVSAGAFVVREHAASTRHFDLRLELSGAMRSWALPKGPSLDPAVKRLAVQVPDHALDDGSEGASERGGVVVWDRGSYEQGGRVPWPEALERGHAVFVLHGAKLSGGFALQRTRPGAKAQWLLIKRRDEHARPGSDIVAEAPASVLSGLTLDELLERGA
jgi:DNA ligase D-like protein (predicted 3'-phosphoesterase)